MAKKAAKKKVVVLIRRSPLNSVKNAEALRQSVGLTLEDNEVAVILLDAAAWLSLPLSPEIIGGGQIKKPLDTLRFLGVPVMVEAASLQRFGIDPNQVIKGIKLISEQEVLSEITTAEVVIPF